MDSRKIRRGGRGRPVTNRESREQGTRDMQSFAETEETQYMSKYGALTLNLPHIPERQGYVQRWVSIRMNGVEDLRNVSRKMNLGWQVRSPETIPQNFSICRIQKENLRDAIVVGSFVLMEKPERLARARQAYFRRLSGRVESSLDNPNTGRRLKQSVDVGRRSKAVRGLIKDSDIPRD